MNASVLVSLSNQASAGLKTIGKDAEEAQKKVESLKNMRMAGMVMAGAGAAGFTAITVAAKESLDTAGQLQDAMKSFEVNAFGQALLPNANPDVIKNVINQAQEIANAKHLTVDFKAKDDAMNFIKAQIDKLSIDMGSKTVFGRKDATQAFDALQKNGVALKDVLSGAGEATMYMAQITKQAPQDAADDISKMASSYMLVGEQVMDLADTIVKVDGASAATAQNIASGFKYAGGTARTLGIHYQDLSIALGSLNSRGLDGTTAGTALNNMLYGIAAPTDKAVTALKGVGLSIDSFKGADGKMKPLQQVIDLVKNATRNLDTFKKTDFFKDVFGEEGARAVLALLESGAGSMAEIRAQMQNSLSITDRASEANKTYSSSVQRAQEAWENLKASFGGPFLDAAANGMDYLAAKLGYFASILQDNPALLKSIVTFAAIASALLLISGTALAGASAFGLFKMGLAASGTSMFSVLSTISTLGLRMGVLGGIAWLVYQNWDKISPYLKAFWNGLKDDTEPVVQWYEDHVAPVVKGVTEGIGNAYQALADKLEQYWPKIEAFLGFTKVINSETHGETKLSWHMPDFSHVLVGVVGILAAFKLLGSATKLIGFVLTAPFKLLSGAIGLSLKGFNQLKQSMKEKLTPGWLKRNKDAKPLADNQKKQSWWKKRGKGTSGTGNSLANGIATMTVHANMVNVHGGSTGSRRGATGGVNPGGKPKSDNAHTPNGASAPAKEKWYTRAARSAGKVAGKAVPFAGAGIAAYGLYQSAQGLGSWKEAISETGGATVGTAAGGALGGLLGSLLGPLGTIAGSYLGSKVGESAGKWLDEKGISRKVVDFFSGDSEKAKRAAEEANKAKKVVEANNQTIGQDMNALSDQANLWGGNLTKSFASGMEAHSGDVAAASSSIAKMVNSYLGVHSPTDKGPLMTNHLWGGNLVQSFAGGMLQNIGKLEGASSQVARAAEISPSAMRPQVVNSAGRIGKLSPELVGDGGGGGAASVKIEMRNEFHITGGASEAMMAEFKKMLKDSEDSLLRKVEQVTRRKQLNAARFEPGVVT